MSGTLLLWLGFALTILFILVLDLGILRRKAHTVTLREAALWSVVWACLAMAFAGGVTVCRGIADGMQFLTGYVIELSLSADNVFLFVVLFTYFKVPAKYQHQVLTWGVLSAILMRGLMIAGGAALIHHFHQVTILFGVFLIFVGIKMFVQRHQEPDMEKNKLVLWMRQHIPLAPQYVGQSFFTRIGDRRLATPLLLVLVLVEITDLIFALDSIPAIFAVTRDPFLVFTSNIFAILGLRSLYFLLAGCMGQLRYFTVGLSGVLIFVGFKMLGILSIPIGISLLVIVSILIAAVCASLMRRSKTASHPPAAAEIPPSDKHPRSAPPHAPRQSPRR